MSWPRCAKGKSLDRAINARRHFRHVDLYPLVGHLACSISWGTVGTSSRSAAPKRLALEGWDATVERDASIWRCPWRPWSSCSSRNTCCSCARAWWTPCRKTTSARPGRRGCGRARRCSAHALQNAVLPTITMMGLQLGYLVGGAVLTETVFAYPGLGRLIYESVTQLDYPGAARRLHPAGHHRHRRQHHHRYGLQYAGPTDPLQVA